MAGVTHTLTYSIFRVTDCRDCPSSKLTSSKKPPHLAMMCTIAIPAMVIDDANYKTGRVPENCPLATGDVMLTRSL